MMKVFLMTQLAWTLSRNTFELARFESHSICFKSCKVKSWVNRFIYLQRFPDVIWCFIDSQFHSTRHEAIQIARDDINKDTEKTSILGNILACTHKTIRLIVINYSMWALRLHRVNTTRYEQIVIYCFLTVKQTHRALLPRQHAALLNRSLFARLRRSRKGQFI